MTPFLQFIFLVALILITAKLGGYLTTAIGQPSVLGELLVGVLLGPTLLNITHLPFITSDLASESIHFLGELGVLILMFLAGLELHISELARNFKVSALSGALGVLVPVGLGTLTGELFGLDLEHSIFLGLTLGATSVSISAQTLMELKALRSRVGLGLLGAAVFDDILVILLLSTFVALADGGGGLAILWVFIRMVLFLAASVAVGIWVLPRLARWVANLPVSQGTLTFGLVVLLLYALAAEVFGGMAAITGTFIAGLMFGRTEEKSQIEAGLRSLAYSFVVPIFFVNIGLSVNIRDLQADNLVFMGVIILLAVIGKILGVGVGARLGGFNLIESLQIGIGMVSRGEVGLIVASIGLQTGHLDEAAFSTIVGMVLVSTLVTPPLLRLSFKGIHLKKKTDPEPEA